MLYLLSQLSGRGYLVFWSVREMALRNVMEERMVVKTKGEEVVECQEFGDVVVAVLSTTALSSFFLS